MRLNPEYVLRNQSQAATVRVNSAPTDTRRVFDKKDKGGWGHNWFGMGSEPIMQREKLWRGPLVQVGIRFRLSGHMTPLPRIGDIFLIDMKSGKQMEAVVTKADYPIDPPDQFFVTADAYNYVGDTPVILAWWRRLF